MLATKECWCCPACGCAGIMAGTNWATTDAYMKRRRTPRHHGLGLLLLLLVIAYGGTATTAGTTTTVAGDKVGPFAPIPEPADPVPGGTSSCAWGVPGCPCGYSRNALQQVSFWNVLNHCGRYFKHDLPIMPGWKCCWGWVHGMLIVSTGHNRV
ncbi:hypothetical protein OEZ86_010014 [Tetradesmus obliquus]|uniref:Pherophorin domain-containing protein n=1 Tax=Tetradesmus obliquus TaxID=3088 RepID=A0ABY8UNU8_TETOB|nr:hypothetical protein OEZ85_001448 [Tetradesmus obliquus]WIA43565.1 hypothetical protein OEZ86_010014 [Tetradesmus obliquus]